MAKLRKAVQAAGFPLADPFRLLRPTAPTARLPSNQLWVQPACAKLVVHVGKSTGTLLWHRAMTLALLMKLGHLPFLHPLPTFHGTEGCPRYSARLAHSFNSLEFPVKPANNNHGRL